MATRLWITTPIARLSRIWAPTLDYSSTWGNWNFNLGPNDWDFLSIHLLLTLTKTGQHSLPPHIWPQELHQGLLNSADGVLSLIPILPQIDKDAWLPNPNEIFPNLQEEPSIHPQNEVNALLHPYWRNAWLQNPNEIFPNLQKEFCIHPPAKVNPLLYPHWRNAYLTPLHPLLVEYIIPSVTHGIPYWTTRVCVIRSNETPQSLPLISLTSPEPTRH